jgi:hypothetical protein
LNVEDRLARDVEQQIVACQLVDGDVTDEFTRLRHARAFSASLLEPF